MKDRPTLGELPSGVSPHYPAKDDCPSAVISKLDKEIATQPDVLPDCVAITRVFIFGSKGINIDPQKD